MPTSETIGWAGNRAGAMKVGGLGGSVTAALADHRRKSSRCWMGRRGAAPGAGRWPRPTGAVQRVAPNLFECV